MRPSPVLNPSKRATSQLPHAITAEVTTLRPNVLDAVVPAIAVASAKRATGNDISHSAAKCQENRRNALLAGSIVLLWCNNIWYLHVAFLRVYVSTVQIRPSVSDIFLDLLFASSAISETDVQMLTNTIWLSSNASTGFIYTRRVNVNRLICREVGALDITE
jgi:hypothetical protein